MRKARAAALAGLVLTGCASQAEAPPKEPEHPVTMSVLVDGYRRDVVRLEDHESGVTCYLLSDSNGMGGRAVSISCLNVQWLNPEELDKRED